VNACLEEEWEEGIFRRKPPFSHDAPQLGITLTGHASRLTTIGAIFAEVVVVVVDAALQANGHDSPPQVRGAPGLAQGHQLAHGTSQICRGKFASEEW